MLAWKERLWRVLHTIPPVTKNRFWRCARVRPFGAFELFALAACAVLAIWLLRFLGELPAIAHPPTLAAQLFYGLPLGVLIGLLIALWRRRRGQRCELPRVPPDGDIPQRSDRG